VSMSAELPPHCGQPLAAGQGEVHAQPSEVDSVALAPTVVPEGLTARLDQTLSNPHRLTVVQRSDLLDTHAEEAFDSLSRLASSLIGTPASFLAVVDDKRDFYKSQYGFPEPVAVARQVRGRTFCHYVVAGSVPLVIDDTHADPLWRTVPVVGTLGVRAYLGVPVFVEGEPIGSFSVIDSSPRTWKTSEIETLVQLSLAATREIQLRVALKAAKTETERANDLAKANEELLAVVIHDLRTPLMVIRMCANLLSGSISTAERDHMDRLVRATDSVRDLVDTLVPTCLARSAVVVHQSAISSNRLLADAADAMRMVAERAGITLTVRPDPAGPIFVDYPQMLRVLGNLIGNCVKYCPPGSSVVLGARDSAESVFISVSDDGPGMSIPDQMRAFDRGWQGSAGTATQDGSGLGLSIVRGLVEQNKGSVTLASQSGRGTRVTIQLPVISARTPPA
jgi:signal transduction histidine kinase